MDEDILTSLIKNSSDKELIRQIGIVFSSIDNICASFQLKQKAPLDRILDKASMMKKNDDLKTLTKEELRTLEDDQDKDEDSCAEKVEAPLEPHHTTIDFESLRRSMKMLFALDDSNTDKVYPIFDILNSVLGTLAFCLPFDLQCTSKKEKIERIITVVVMVFDLMCLGKIILFKLEVRVVHGKDYDLHHLYCENFD